jgi:hypothetical protein
MGDGGAAGVLAVSICVLMLLVTLGMTTQLHGESLRTGELRLSDGTRIELARDSPNVIVHATGDDPQGTSAENAGLGSALAKGAFGEPRTHYITISASISSDSARRVGSPPASTVPVRSSTPAPTISREHGDLDRNGTTGAARHHRAGPVAESSLNAAAVPVSVPAASAGDAAPISGGRAPPHRQLRAGVPSGLAVGTRVLILRLNNAMTGEAVWETVVGAIPEPAAKGETGGATVTAFSKQLFLLGGPSLDASGAASAFAGAESRGDCGYIAPFAAESAEFPLRTGVEHLWIAYLATIGASEASTVNDEPGTSSVISRVRAACWSTALGGTAQESPVHGVPIGGQPVALDPAAGDAIIVRAHVGVSRSLRSLAQPGGMWGADFLFFRIIFFVEFFFVFLKT